MKGIERKLRHQLDDISVFDDNSSKTLNNKFSIYKTNRKEIREDEEVEVIDEVNEKYEYQKNTESQDGERWKDNFLKHNK